MANLETSQLERTPLFEQAVAQKAKLTAFSGWEMPVQFSGLKQEHDAVRTSVGMFDISHMGKFTFSGKDLLQQLQPLVPSDLLLLKPGQSQYTVLLNSQGGIIDDIIFYYQGETNGQQKGVMIVNAGTTSKDKTWLLNHLDAEAVGFVDRTADQVLIAIQGPQALAKLQPLVGADLTPMKAFSHLETKLLGSKAFIARTGYTGEDGFEVMVDIQAGRQLWSTLAESGVFPCGLGARDTLRLEAAMPLYGQEITDNISPLEAGLGWVVHLDTKSDFIARNILESQKASGLTRRLVGIEMEGRNIARHDYTVLFEGNIVGIITSGTMSPTLNKPIALAYVPTVLSKVGQKLEVEIRGKSYPGRVVKKPFYRSSSRVTK